MTINKSVNLKSLGLVTMASISMGALFSSGGAVLAASTVAAPRPIAGQLSIHRGFSDIASFEGLAPASGARRLGTSVEVVPSGELNPGASGDEQIRERVVKAIYDLDDRDNEAVHVRVKDAVVYLYGTVPSTRRSAARMSAAMSVPGVRSAVDELRVVQRDFDAR